MPRTGLGAWKVQTFRDRDARFLYRTTLRLSRPPFTLSFYPAIVCCVNHGSSGNLEVEADHGPEQVHKLCQGAAERILNDFRPQLMVAIGGGGYVPARILRYALTKPHFLGGSASGLEEMLI